MLSMHLSSFISSLSWDENYGLGGLCGVQKGLGKRKSYSGLTQFWTSKQRSTKVLDVSTLSGSGDERVSRSGFWTEAFINAVHLAALSSPSYFLET